MRAELAKSAVPGLGRGNRFVDNSKTLPELWPPIYLSPLMKNPYNRYNRHRAYVRLNTESSIICPQ